VISLRPYQAEAKQAVLDYWAAGGGSPLVDLATGLGKSVVIASLVRELAEDYPAMRILMLVHSRELVAQNFAALMRSWPQAPAGLYSAGLNRRDAHHRITFAGIQSVYRKAAELGPRDLILIDEAHLCPNEGSGMYRTLLEGLREMREDLRVCGFTATPFRMDSGRLDQGANKLFDDVVYSFGIGRGVDEGWLTPLVSKGGGIEIDVSGVGKRGGEFISGALEAAADTDEVTRAAVSEFTQLGANRRSWLIFCTGVKHAHHVRDAVRASGISCEVITGDTPGAERDRILDDLRSGKLRAVTNANCLTTGLDVPGIDMIVLLRPTLSKGLYVQIAGRGTRLFDGKENCLFLDYTGTCRRMGPVDSIEVSPKREKAEADETKVKVDEVRAKECPNCQTLAGLSARVCKVCGHEWPPAVIHEREADTTPILSRDLKTGPQEIALLSWSAKRHVKVGSPDSLRIDYLAGVQTYRKWLAFDHGGYGLDKAQRWWLKHGPAPAPKSVEDALVRWPELAKPSHIIIKQDGKWADVVSQRFAEVSQ
jgi:DNA repair protein RadD